MKHMSGRARCVSLGHFTTKGTRCVFSGGSCNEVITSWGVLQSLLLVLFVSKSVEEGGGPVEHGRT